MRTPKDLDYNGYTSVLLRYDDGQPALWVRDNYLAHETDNQTYSICDINICVPIGANQDVDEMVEIWKRNVKWH